MARTSAIWDFFEPLRWAGPCRGPPRVLTEWA